ncbi:putative cobalt-precorrin-6B C(15)-methyltransferase (decarboxylating) [uncultured archaeon]|nr:putative cobalt-precorrin-6B C(15)-methyltransferase (decarboxylating) [uncultured archaeon]
MDFIQLSRSKEVCLTSAYASIYFTRDKSTWIKLISVPFISNFMKLPGTTTQEENIHIAMGKLDIRPSNVFLDLGCGSGAVSLAASRYTDRIYGIDVRKDAVEASKSKVPGGVFLCGDASDLLPELPRIDRCFIGVTRQIEVFFPKILERAVPDCVIVANLARIVMASKVTELMKACGIFQELLHVQISRGYELAGDFALKPINPIFMVVGKC